MNKEELLIYIGNKIKDFRKQKKLNQSDLAKQIGVTNTSISEYERGKVNIDADTLFKIAEVLGVSVDDLFPERNQESPLDLMDEFRSVNLDLRHMMLFKEMFEKTSSMTEEDRKNYLDNLKFTIQVYEKMQGF